MVKTRAFEESANVADEAVLSAEAAKVEQSFHCTECKPSKPGYTLDSNVFDEKTGKLTHHFVNESNPKDVLDESCGGKQ